MSLHEQIAVFQTRYVEDRRDCAILSPAAVASATLQAFLAEHIEPHVEYAALEHFKHMARKTLARRFDHESDENPVYSEQGELFSGHLQERYPAARKAGDEPTYKLLEAMTDADFAWNVRSLRRSARARALHADALEARWRESGSQSAAA